jgi:DNA polymerase elongation subunit (family B)
MLQGDLIEDPDYIISNNIQINYNYYIEKQIQKPLLQLFSYVEKYQSEKLFKNIKNIGKNFENGQKNIMDFLFKK